MKKLATLTAVAAGVCMAFGFGGVAQAGPLAATTSLQCSLVGGDTYFVDWGDISGTEKYAVSIECVTEATDADGDEADIFEGVFDTGTSECFVAEVFGHDPEPEQGVAGVDCTGLLATEMSIDVGLIVDAGGFNPSAGAICTVTVKGVHSGKGKGRQDKTNHLEASVGCPDYP